MKIDFHTHTKYSWDAFSSPEEVVDAAIEKGINCICITDHGETRGATEAMKYAFDRDILVIPGIEILTPAGEILGINIKKVIPNGLSVKETIREIQRQGGMAIIPHPFSWPVGKFKGKEQELLFAGVIEVFNATSFNFANKKALKLAQRLNLAFTAGSDAHRAKFVGRGYLEFAKDNLSENELLEEVKNKTGKIRGEALTFWETIENSRKMDPIKVFKDYYAVKSKKRKV